MNKIFFDQDNVIFKSYPFPGASVFPSGSVPYSNIRDVDPSTAPPEIRLHTGETLFIPADLREEFEAAITKHKLKVYKRVDVWEFLLEPFLDTNFTKEESEQTFKKLEEVGVSRKEAKRIRLKVGLKMFAYNSIHWDWVHLGLSDLLDAYLPIRPLRSFSFLNYRFRRLYSFAMVIAERGRLKG